MSKIISLTAENVKRLSAVYITPQGNVVVVAGENGAGKTSVLDSIAMVFGGKDEIPSKPVRIGADKAKILCELDNGLVIKRTFTAAGGTSLVVENKEGARYSSPQAILDGLTGKLMFDPLAFTRMDRKRQAEALRKLVGLDLTEFDAKRKGLYDERTLANKEFERARTLAESMPINFGVPPEPVDTADLVLKLEGARKHNEQRAKLGTAIEQARREYEDQREKTASIRAEILRLEELLATTRAMLPGQEEKEKEAGLAHDKAIAAHFDFPSVDETPIREALAGAAVTNKQVQENKARAAALANVSLLKQRADKLTEQIDALDKEKAAKLASAPFPIPGLSFDENGVTFNGVPFDQASGAEQIRISVAMGAALNPKLRVMLVRDGSLLDAKSMTLLAELAEAHNLQVWVERVSEKDGPASVVIEDGHVAGAQVVLDGKGGEAVVVSAPTPAQEAPKGSTPELF